MTFGNGVRGFGGGLAEDDEHRSPRLEVQRHRGASVGDLERRRLRSARLRVPEFGRLAGHAERGIDRLVAIVAVVDEVEIAIGQLAVDEQQVGVALGLGVVEVGRDVQLR